MTVMRKLLIGGELETGTQSCGMIWSRWWQGESM